MDRQRPHALTFAGYGAFVAIGWTAVLFPALILPVEHDFGVSDAQFGLLYFVGSLLYAVGSFGGGLLTERFGRRAVLPFSALLLGVGLLLGSTMPIWVGLLVCFAALNLGDGAIDGGINGLFLDLFRETRGGELNLLHLFFSVGAFLSPFAVGLLVSAGVPWRALVAATGVCVLPLAVILWGTGMPSGHHRETPEDQDEVPYGGAESSLLPFAGLALAICLYVAAEMAVSAWVVKLLSSASLATATGILSIFWFGLAAGRLLSRFIADHFDPLVFTVGCIVLMSLSMVSAVLSPVLALSAVLFGVCGLFSGPIFPMIMVMGANIYERRIARLSGSLAASAVVGGLIYPPLIGLMASNIGIRAGLLGAAALGIPAVGGVVFARVVARRLSNVVPAAARRGSATGD